MAKANEKCAACPYFKYCAGGCRVMAIALTEEPTGSDLTKCIFFSKGYHKKIEALMDGWTNAAPIREN